MSKRRRWWIAFLLGLWCPGLGHVYCGIFLQGMKVFLGFNLLMVGAYFLLSHFVIIGLLTVFSCALFCIGSALQAARIASRIKEIEIKRYNRWYCYVGIALALLMLVSGESYSLRRFVVEPFKVPSVSMEPTILSGDHILVKKSAYFSEKPQRGDLIIYVLPKEGVNVIKRVVAIPGDTVELRGKELRINGELKAESYVQYSEGGAKDLPLLTVPEGKVVVLGDNRDLSKDSRYYESPFIDQLWIKGRAFAVYWSAAHWERIGLRW